VAGGFFGGMGGGFGGIPFGGVCIGQDAVGFVDVFAVFGKGVVQVLPSGGISAGEFAFAVIDVFAVVGKAVCCFVPGLRVAAFQGFAVEEDGVAVGGVEAVKQAECKGIGGLDFAAAGGGILADCAVAVASFGKMIRLRGRQPENRKYLIFHSYNTEVLNHDQPNQPPETHAQFQSRKQAFRQQPCD